MGAKALQTEDELKAFLKEKAKKAWDDEGHPYWLSYLAPDLKPLGVDYKTILGEERLKQFARRTEGDSYRYVEHPRMKAKVGIVPPASEFEFADEPLTQPAETDRRGDQAAEREQAVLHFFRALSKLSDDELEGIVIPTSVLVKLLGRR